MIKNTLLCIGVFGALIGALELGAFLWGKIPEPFSCSGCYVYDPDPQLGFWHKPDSSREAVRHCGRSLCYRARYTFDAVGRRKTGNERRSARHLLLFGCSYAFGEGLNDRDTLSYKLQESIDARLYNYSRSSVSAAYTLALFQSGRLAREVSEKDGLALYLLMVSHFERASFSTRNPWLWKDPAYTLDAQGELRRHPTQAATQGRLFSFYYAYTWLKRRSYFLTVLARDFHSLSESQNQKLLVKMLGEAKAQYEREFHGEFIVVIFPNFAPSRSFLEELEQAKIRYFMLEQFTVPEAERVVCPCDSHPNGLVTTHMARQIRQIFRANFPQILPASARARVSDQI